MLIINKKNIDEAAKIIKNGGIVAIPTETVYGLAGNALDGEVIKKIFKAKARPQDNPLIVHISKENKVKDLVSNIPYKASLLMEKFWPGPITIILPKSNLVPYEVTAGLESVAIRMPKHELAREIIDLSDVPLAAPSANRSGCPSPTSAEHVIKDMFGRIDAVVDGGDCEFGLESTVISFLGETPILLRPGVITPDEIKSVTGEIKIDKSVFGKFSRGNKVISPGMKYTHYSPKANVIIVEGNQDDYIKFVNSNLEENSYALCFDEDVKFINKNSFSYGKISDLNEQSAKLFKLLRYLDTLGARTIYARTPKAEGVGLAIYNRLVRAAGFNIVNLSKNKKTEE